MSWKLFDGEGFFWISCLHLCWRASADICCQLRHDACLLRAVRFGWLLGVADRLLSKPGGDRRCLEPESVEFFFCNVVLRAPAVPLVPAMLAIFLLIFAAMKARGEVRPWLTGFSGEKVSRIGVACLSALRMQQG